MSEWIDINNSMPEFGIAVLTIGKSSNGNWSIPITAQLWADENGIKRFISGFSFHGDRLIKTMVETKATHWQPLPKPPQ